MPESRISMLLAAVVASAFFANPVYAQPAPARPVPAPTFASGLTPALPDLHEKLDFLQDGIYLNPVVAGMGSFTYADTQLPSPFARWFEGELRLAFSRTDRISLFDRLLGAAMDPLLRELYKKFLESDHVNSILYGRYSLEGNSVRVTMSLTDLATGILLKETLYQVPLAAVPSDIGIRPSSETSQSATELTQLVPAGARQGIPFALAIAADRGVGATYRDGEKLTLFVTSTEDAYLKLYHVDVNGIAQRIWPNRFGGSGRIAAGQMMKFPSSSDGFQYILGRPYGTEYIKAVACTQPFATMEAPDTDLSGPPATVITRGLPPVASTASATWAEALVVYEILP